VDLTNVISDKQVLQPSESQQHLGHPNPPGTIGIINLDMSRFQGRSRVKERQSEMAREIKAASTRVAISDYIDVESKVNRSAMKKHKH
jgi:hypothetical protein